MDNGQTFIIVPTFREEKKIRALLDCFSKVTAENIKMLVVNADPGDETSAFLRQLGDERVLEIHGNPSLYWSGLVNLGLRHVMRNETNREFVIIMNADVEFERDTIPALIDRARSMPRAQLAAVTVSGGRVVSSGVRVVSWFLTVNRHPLAGMPCESVARNLLVPVDFLPTRCTLIPAEAVEKAGLTAERELPHYGGDNEYTNRVRKIGYPAYIFSGARVRVDAGNTGTDVFLKRLSLAKRVRSIFSIKSTSNPIYRLRFVRMSHPAYAWPSAMFLYLMRSLLEVLFGGGAIRFVVRRRESGFSGY